MHKNRYFLTSYIRCGEMPLYLIFYQDHQGRGGHSVMLCTLKKLQELLRQFKGFNSPKQYGKVLYHSRENEPSDTLRAILKARYSFDLSYSETTSSARF
jgi:hypothetical protein